MIELGAIEQARHAQQTKQHIRWQVRSPATNHFLISTQQRITLAIAPGPYLCCLDVKDLRHAVSGYAHPSTG